MQLFSLDLSNSKHPTLPKYLQLAQAIIEDIESESLKLNEQLPSVNRISKELGISRETVFKALNHLSERGIIKSSNRQGYFITKTDIRSQKRIFFLLDKFTPFKEQLYMAFKNAIGEQGDVEIFFHHHNISVFRSLIIDNLPHYTHFVILTFLRESVKDILNLIPEHKRLIIDSYEPNLQGECAMIYQDFAANIYAALEQAGERLKKYKRLILVAPGSLFHASWIIEGFRKFSSDTGFSTKIIRNIKEKDFKRGDAYVVLSGYDVELAQIIKLGRSRGLVIGQDIGIIAYNDSPIKEILEGGITVITTDWDYMGKEAASMLLEKRYERIANPTQIIFRSSL